jgi:hypothetical protein
MGYLDTGLCVPETAATLAIQQAQLVAGKRDVQMFPIGTAELPAPSGFTRHQNARGVFHFRPDAISAEAIEALSAEGRENEFLMLGPISKPEVAKRVLAGELLFCITERTPEGIEVRSAAGTDKTIDEQREYFEHTKEPGNTITISGLSHVICARLREAMK